MGELMRGGDEEIALAAEGVGLGRREDQFGCVGDEAGVFHGSAEERHGHFIELFVRIRDVEVLFELVENDRGHLGARTRHRLCGRGER